ncbi:DNA glycosylase [Ceratobasidium sp. AG-I]|nr:DNA glycosylase [Ceratobasidium sp. AG-I]
MSITPFKSLKLPLAQLNLKAVLKCGQSFRWTVVQLGSDNKASPTKTEILDDSKINCPPPTEEWRLTLTDRVVCLRQTDDELFYRACFPSGSLVDSNSDATDSTLQWLRDYFQLDIDLEKLYSQWNESDPVFKKVAPRFVGIRILRQDPWENLVSFICSQNNHISRITSMVHSLCIHYSPPLCSSLELPGLPLDSAWHPFPPPSALADPKTESKLRELGFGYRAKYIQKTAAMLCEKHEDPMKMLLGLRKLPTSEAREQLLEFHGVGPKVADCILLMSLDKAEVVPVDTHVQQIATKMYGFKSRAGQSKAMNPKLYSEIANKFADTWGPYAGWAHSVLFTADLKSFASFGLEPSAAVASTSTTLPLPSPALVPSVSPLDEALVNNTAIKTAPKPRASKKRKSDANTDPSISHVSKQSMNDIVDDIGNELSGETSLAGRVKRRRQPARGK